MISAGFSEFGFVGPQSQSGIADVEEGLAVGTSMPAISEHSGIVGLHSLGIGDVTEANAFHLFPAQDLARIYRNAGFTVIQTSAETGDGVEELGALLKGKFAAFTGNSGVGKSSILNRLAPELGLKTGEVSEKLGRGRHTTRHVALYRLDEETYVADTPGFSSFDTDQMDVILKENLQFAFPDFGPYIGACQFHDCSHRKEPGCAVRVKYISLVWALE